MSRKRKTKWIKRNYCGLRLTKPKSLRNMAMTNNPPVIHGINRITNGLEQNVKKKETKKKKKKKLLLGT